MKTLIIRAMVAAGLLAPLTIAPAAQAQEAFVGEIILVGENFCPRGYADANGQLLAVSQNDALFSLLGTIYGGDGRTTFGLPDLRGRVATHVGTGPGLSPYTIGQKGGAEQSTITAANLPAHNHTGEMVASSSPADSTAPSGTQLASVEAYSSRGTPTDSMGPGTVSVGNTGGSQSTNLIQPVLALRYCVALFGIYPSRN